jgi:ABC-type Fe3+ transport system permease subunit
MRILDFIIYYIALYFTRNSQLLSWSSAIERSCYVISIATGFWIFTFWEITTDYVLKETNTHPLPTIQIIIVVICILLLYQYIYINRKRYELITSKNYRQFRVKDKNGIVIVIIFCIISFLLPFALAIYTGITRSP